MLDKIKAEIEQIEPYDLPWDKRTPEHIRDMAVEIVEKYAEQEPCDDDYQTDMDEAWKQAKREPCENCCNGNQIEKAKLCQKSYLAGMEHKQEQCGNAINRQHIIEQYTSCADMLNDEELKGANLIMEWIYNAPPVNPQEQTGHWIRQDNTKEPLYGWYFCSECNSVIGDKTKFCSNCGARMFEPQESEDKG